jgi:AP-3 complex subunit beta
MDRNHADVAVTQSVLVIRSLLRSSPERGVLSRAQVIGRLVRLLETNKIKSPAARATVYWLVGEYAVEGLLETVAADVLRLGAKSFETEVSVWCGPDRGASSPESPR